MAIIVTLEGGVARPSDGWFDRLQHGAAGWREPANDMQYSITLGTIVDRRGHRKSCSQVSVTYLVEADTALLARKRLELAYKNANDPTESPYVTLARIEINFDKVSSRDVREVNP